MDATSSQHRQIVKLSVIKKKIMPISRYSNFSLFKFLQLGEIHTEALFAVLPLKLYLNELRAAIHLAFQDNTFAKHIVTDFIARFELLNLRLRGFWSWRS